MSLAAQRSALKAIVEAINGIGKVHEYLRWSNDDQQLQALFMDPVLLRLQGWTITREESPERYLFTQSNERQHVWVIRGYRALDDAAASEPAFQDLAEAVCDELRKRPTLNATAQGNSGPPQVALFEPRLFAGVLCHHVEIRLISNEIVQYVEV